MQVPYPSHLNLLLAYFGFLQGTVGQLINTLLEFTCAASQGHCDLVDHSAAILKCMSDQLQVDTKWFHRNYFSLEKPGAKPDQA